LTDNNLLSITPSKPDAQLAEEIRAELVVALGVVSEIMNRANAHGLQIAFNMGRDQFGRNKLHELQIMRIL
jgi:hypothetical protein